MKVNATTIKDRLIKKGIKKLKQYGFVNVDAGNILTDDVYKHYFIQILHSHLGANGQSDSEIQQLLKIIEPGKKMSFKP
jgi:hypothetical protein